MAHVLHYAQGSIPAGADALTGYFVTGVPEGKQFNCVTASYLGGDSNEIYSLAVVPADQSTNEVTIDALTGTGITQVYEQAKGGGTAQSLFSRAGQTNSTPIPGPCTVVVYGNTATAAEFSAGVFGTISDLGEGL